jgi:hypothetical protein
MSRVLPSLKVPVAVNCCFVPCTMLPFAGWIEIEVRFAAFTVSNEEPLTPPKEAEMVVEPTLLEVSNPLEVMLATLVDDEDHLATLVTFCELPSEKVAVAVNCWLTPNGCAGFSGVTEIEAAVAELTVRPVEPLTVPIIATMFALPAETALPRPVVGAELLIVATAGFEEDQLTVAVRFCVLLSL